MKKGLKFLLVIFALVLVTGCNKDNKENIVDDNNLIIKNPGIKLGEEVYDIKLNNKNKKLRVEYNNYPESKIDIDVESFYITYTVYLDNVKIDGGYISIYDDLDYMHDDLDYVKKLANADKTFKLSPSYDIETYIIKGTDNKEYLLLVYCYGDYENFIIVNDNGKELGNLAIDTGSAPAYTIMRKNGFKSEEQGYQGYYYIDNSDNKIFYINPSMCEYSDEVDRLVAKVEDEDEFTVDFDEYEITINNDKIISSKTGVTYEKVGMSGASPVDCEIVTLTIK